jgi:transposase-like protein
MKIEEKKLVVLVNVHEEVLQFIRSNNSIQKLNTIDAFDQFTQFVNHSLNSWLCKGVVVLMSNMSMIEHTNDH